MNPQRWQRIEDVYLGALPLAQPQRSQYVSNACNGDHALQEQVESLLLADDSAGKFLETGIFELGLKILANDDGPETATAFTSPTRSPMAGVMLAGRYRIDRELAHGGVGVVYLAHDHRLHNKQVVVKLLLEKFLQNEWVTQKFQQEKEALARVDHPGVVGILDAGELNDRESFIVMQFVDGISLREAVKGEPEGLDLERAATIIKQIGAALSAVHARKIYHRDLKPENIMLQRLTRDEEQVKILDFGIAKVKESLVAPSTVTGAISAGTVVYMSPEQLRGDRVTAASDIYAMGLIAYEMITGRRPFKPDTIAQLSDMQREGVRVKPVDLRPRLPEKAQTIILRALAFDPAARYQNAADFGADLSRALMGEEETITPDREWEQAQPIEDMPPQPDTLVTPLEPAYIASATQVHPHSAANPESGKRVWPKIAAIAGAVVLIFTAYLVIANRGSLFGAKTNSGTTPAARSLTYFLTVQKMRDGKEYQDPFQSSGQEVFENGYRFWLNLSSPQSGYLYVFNEGAAENGGLSFTIIYPTPKTNNGSAKLESNQSIRTSGNTFEGKAGTEQFWIVWAASSVSELEAARDAAFRDGGELTDAGMVRVLREFLTKRSEPKPATTKDTLRQQTNVQGAGDVLVKLVELEHR